ncbi:hypothetical protein KUCAC02_015428 [Chaenocephalus aceratus]|uniref:Uncharacterized protein n=1 Tax=Chaenocephalus aceratus TaxID=36190 RepID=A0ACB9XXA7_CHAAC|nr:hypothetical protein KUCAC02_015428 [Chaenocephalus aceratus]
MLMLAGIVLLHITTIILLLVAAIDNAWWVTNTVSTDLWGRWELANSAWHYTNLKDYPEEYLQAVQATGHTQLFTLPKGQRFTFSGILQLISCLCIMIAASIYTAKLHPNETEGGFGHSYVLAWISFVLTFILAITYLILRKKSE